ncbi:hypothetical protein SMICM304S_09439 [Streptomyces microflavus]
MTSADRVVTASRTSPRKPWGPSPVRAVDPDPYPSSLASATRSSLVGRATAVARPSHGRPRAASGLRGAPTREGPRPERLRAHEGGAGRVQLASAAASMRCLRT